MATVPVSIHRHARAESFAPAIANRTTRLATGAYTAFHHVLLVTDGTARLELADKQSQRLIAPGAAYLPAGHAGSIVVEAGAACALIGVSPDILVDALGNRAESYSLRIFSERAFVAGDTAEAAVAELRPLADGLIRELRDPARESWMVVASMLSLILTGLWRSAGHHVFDDAGQGEVASILQRFRQSVEVHFRDHRPIAAYASELGLSADRLHAICRRTLGRAPLRLLHDRVVHEARTRLERSAGTVGQISDELGFRDPIAFSQFFKRQTGTSPAEYRRQIRSAAGAAQPPSATTFADWP